MSTSIQNSVPSKRLAASIASTDYSFTVTDILSWDGVTNLASADFGTIGYGVFRNDTNTAIEFFSFDPTTLANASITILKRGLKYNGDISTEVSANKLTWVKNQTIVELGSNPPQAYAYLKSYIDGIAIAGAPNATSSTQGLLQVPTASQINSGTALGSTGAPLAVTPDTLLTSNYGVNIPSTTEKAALTALTVGLVGVIVPYAGRSAPTGFLLCDGSAVSRATYASLFAILCPSGTFTVTIASPGVFTKTSHGFLAGEKIHFTTTGGLPSGLATNTDYYVISAGLTANAFEVALSPGGPAIVTTGSQSGTHTVFVSNWGRGDGTTTFNLPDLRSKSLIGTGQGATYSLPVDNSKLTLAAPGVWTVPDNEFPYQGQAVTLTTTGALPTGYATSTTYYVIRTSTTTITLATSQANADAGTGITTSGSQSGVHSIVSSSFISRTTVAKNVGEETHGISITELAGHTHPPSTGSFVISTSGSPVLSNLSSNGVVQTSGQTGSTGGDTQHNNIGPAVTVNYIIKT